MPPVALRPCQPAWARTHLCGASRTAAFLKPPSHDSRRHVRHGFQKPAHGSVAISASQYEYTYQSKPGFHGLDLWEATIQGAARGELQPPQKLNVIMMVK